MTYDAGSVALKVVPSFQGVQQAIRTNSEKWGDQAAKVLADRIGRGIRDGVEGAIPPATAPREGERFGRSFGDQAKRAIKNALDSLPKVKVDADSTPAQREIADLRTQLEALSKKSIGVDIDAAAALAEMDKIKERLRVLADSDPNIDVRIDASTAEAQLAVVQRLVNKLDRDDVHINVDVDSSSALLAERSFNGLLVAGMALGPALVPALAAATAGALALGAASAGAVGGIGVLALGFSGIKDAVTALGAAHNAAATDAQASAAKQANAARSIANAQQGVVTAEIQVQRARQDAAYAAEDAARRVKDAQAQVVTAEKDAAQQIQQALRAQSDAERSLATAQANAREAQLALTAARKQAKQDLEDLDNQVKDGAIAQRQAVLDLQDAKAQLDAVLADPQATNRQREQAQINYDQQQQQFSELQTSNARLAKEQADAHKKGIDGSAAVQSAQQRQVAAVQQVADATRALGDASKAVDQARVDGAAKVAKAEQGVADAVRAQQHQAVTSARSIADAQRGVASAQSALAAASAAGAVQMSSTAQAAAQALDALSPAGKRFALFIDGLRPWFKELRGAAQDGLLPGVQSGLQTLLATYGPMLQNYVGKMAKVLGDLFDKGSKALTAPFWKDFFKTLADAGPGLLKTAGAIGGDLVTGLAGIVKAFLPSGKSMTKGIESFTKKFAEFGKNLSSSKGFKSFMDYVRTVGPKIVKFFEALGGAVVNIAKALAPVGPPIIDALTKVFDFIGKMDPKQLLIIAGAIGGMVLAFQGIVGITSVVSQLGVAFDGIKKAKGILGGTEKSVGLLSKAFGFLTSPVGLVILGIALLVAGLIYAYKHSETFRNIVNAVFKKVKEVAKAVFEWFQNTGVPMLITAWDGIKKAAQWLWQNVLKPTFSFIKTAFEKTVTAMKWAWDNILHPTFNVIAKIVKWLWNNVIKLYLKLIKLEFQIAFAAIKFYWEHILHPVFNVLKSVVQFLWTHVIKPSFSNIKTLISDVFKGIKKVWDNVLHPVFSAVKSVVSKLPDAFKTATSLIGKAWDGLKEIAKAPIRFVIDTVINKGIIGTFNKVAHLFGAGDSLIKPIPMPDALKPVKKASGGHITGPGTETSDSIPALLSRNEFVVRASQAKRYRAVLESINSGNGIPGLPGFATGGAVGWATRHFKSAASNAGHLLAAGANTIKNGAGAVFDVAKDPIGFFKEKLRQLMASAGDSPMLSAVMKAPAKLVDSAVKKIQSFFGGGDDPNVIAYNPSGGVERWSGIVRNALTMLGQPQTLLNVVLRRMQRESGGNPRAINNWDINAKNGTPSKGLMQVIDPTFRAFALSPFNHNIYDPMSNILASMRYALSRYGSLPAAYNRAGGYKAGGLVTPSLYDNGGVLPSGVSTVVNASGKPEAVLTNAQWALIHKIATTGQTASQRTYHVHTSDNPVAILRTLRQSEALDAALYPL